MADVLLGYWQSTTTNERTSGIEGGVVPGHDRVVTARLRIWRTWRDRDAGQLGHSTSGPRPGWRTRLDEAEIAAVAGCGVDRAGDLLAVLGSEGLAGRDLVEDGWFRRDLPFSAELIPMLQPRVRRAAEITDADLSA